jgi:hypothetical protein
MAGGEYTPKTEIIRLGYSYRPNLPEGERHHPPLLEEFDRWLKVHDAEVAAKAVEEVADAVPVDLWSTFGGVRRAAVLEIQKWIREKAFPETKPGAE